MKTLIALVPLVMVLILGVCCPQTPSFGQGRDGNSVPPDFVLSYRRGPAHADWGGAVRFSLSADGGYSVERQARGRGAPGSWEVKAQGAFSRLEMEKIYQAVNEQGFWSLRRHYRNPDVMDGTVGSLRVRAGSREHTVVMSNMELPQVTVILGLLRREVVPRNRTVV